MGGRVKGKVALITGAASGIGRGCAEKLAAEGATVVLTDVQDDKGADVAAAIVEAGGKADYLHHDVTDEAAWEDIISQVKVRYGRLDTLVNNAGIAIGGSVLTMTLADWRKQTGREPGRRLPGQSEALDSADARSRSGEGGSIINMSSVAGLKGSG